MPPSPLRKRTRLIAWLGAAVVIGLDALIAQMDADCARAREVLADA